MNTKRKIGIILILLGVGIPLVLFFFQEEDIMFSVVSDKWAKRRLSEEEIKAIEDRIAKIKEKAETKGVLTTQELIMMDAVPAREEIWDISTHRELNIPYRRFIGLGIFLILSGLAFLIFSFPQQKRNQKIGP